MTNFYSIGVMQGRLLLKYKGSYQAHPVGYWQDEFEIASKLGLDSIEFIFDYESSDKNPLVSEDGLNEVSRLTERTGIEVKSICADYFMEAPLHSPDVNIRQNGREVIKTLISSAKRLGVSDIVIPCLDKFSLSDKDMDNFVNSIFSVLDLAEEASVNLALETDMPPARILSLLNRFSSSRITVNYDIGNSASLGYDPEEEIAAYGGRISDIHVKDRLFGGGPVMLGEGCVDWNRVISALKKIGYNGLFVMQAYRDEDGARVFKEQLATFIGILHSHGYEHRVRSHDRSREKRWVNLA